MSQSAYLAGWLMDPRRGGVTSSDVDTVAEVVIPLLQATIELYAEVLQVGTSEMSAADLRRHASALRDRAVQQIEERLASLQRIVASRRGAMLLRAESGDGEVLGDLEAMLALPLLDWRSRRDVRVASRSLQRQRREDWLRSAGGIPKASDEPKSSAADWTKLKRHPLDLILSADHNTSSRGGGIRISTFSSRVDTASRRAATLPGIEQRRIAFGEQAARVRFAAPLWFPTKVAEALKWDLRTNLQSLLAWHTERTLDDFWGPAGEAVAFFEQAAGDYLKAAQQFDPPGNPEQPQGGVGELHALQQKLAAGRTSAAVWIRTVTAPALQLERGESATAAVSVMGQPAAKGFDPPVGLATVMVRDGNAARLPARFEPSDSLAVPVLGAKVNVTVPPPAVASTEGFNVQTVFRGHEYGDRMSLQPIGGYRVDVRPHDGLTAEVTLNAPREPLSVAFILDASASMAKGLGGDTGGPPRIEIAKDVLRESLTRLADRGDCRAAVRFFGHRIGWSTDKPVRPLPRPDLKPATIDGLRPSQDVETVLPFGPLNPMSVRRVLPSLEAVTPWGQSPLYLSLVKSLNDLRNAGTVRNTHVVVITDGANYQFIPPGQQGVAATSLNDVRNVWSGVPVPIHIFGLGIDRAEDGQAIEAFEQLCRQTGGRFHPLQRAADLKDALSDLLNTGDYRLRRNDGTDASPRAAPLGTTLRVQCRPHPNVDCQVEYGDASSMVVEPLSLSPGQSVRLYVDASTRSIRAYPFDQDVAAAVPMVNARQKPAGVLVRMHRTRQTGRGVVTFPISWQRVAGGGRGDALGFRATAEPQSVWVRIQPITADGQPVGEAYVFYDSDFVADQPVPLLELPAEDWPRTASRAAIDVWSRPAASFSAGRQASSGVTLSPPATGKTATAGLSTEFSIGSLRDSEIEAATGVRLVLDREDDRDGLKRLRFLIRGHDDSVAVTDYKLDLIDGRMGRPDRIVRQFDRRNRVAVHTFYLDPKQAPRFDRVRLVDRVQQTSGAWRLREGAATIPVVRSSGLLRAIRLPPP
jgi:Mg-chelatase subunit ChlD